MLGSASITDDVITYVADGDYGTDVLTINGRQFSIVVLEFVITDGVVGTPGTQGFGAVRTRMTILLLLGCR